jgi:aspartate-semialdehyde dehydrogenase
MSSFVVGIVGATGAVGIELIKCLHHRKFQLSSLRLFASSKSAGKPIETAYGLLTIEEFSVSAARECKFVFLAVSGDFALQYAQEIADGDGPFVIDNSSAFRYNPEIPLVVRNFCI